MTAVVVVLAVIVGLEFCQALELVSVPGLYIRRIPYAYSVALSGMVLMATVLLLQSSIAAVSALLLVDVVLGGAALSEPLLTSRFRHSSAFSVPFITMTRARKPFKIGARGEYHCSGGDPFGRRTAGLNRC